MAASVAIYGLLAEFFDANALVAAPRPAHEASFRRMYAYAPFPIEELADALGFHKTRLPLLVLLGGVLGGVSGYLMEYWTATTSYPLNVGGRPLHSWPAFIPVTFELTILGAALFAVLGMLALNGLPMPHHPVFNAPRFALASRDRFFLCIEAADQKFERISTGTFLMGTQAVDVTEVTH